MEGADSNKNAQQIDFSLFEFQTPTKKIDDLHSMETFKNSDSCRELLAFLTALSKSVQGTKMSQTPLPENLKPIYNYLETLDKWLDEIPPVEQPMRFGNKAFKTWLDRVVQNVDQMAGKFSNQFGFERAVQEFKVYLIDSFGSYERIDYGTGHELNFIVTLLCLFKLQVFKPEDFQAVVNKIFQRYMQLMRKIQLQYLLEPAGSHGVWGLDDYQHLAFYLGASQLIKNEEGYTPDSIHVESNLVKDSDEYMYFACIQFIKKVKKGVPFGESSPMLNDISAVPNWEKVTQGLMKMFQAEVIGKHPVIKHLKFGSLLPFPK